MKKIILLPIILGSALLVTGGVIFTIAVLNSTSNSTIVTKTKKLDDETFSKFDINLETSDVEFKVSSDGSKKVVFTETEKNYHTCKVDNDTLIINQVDDRKWYETILDFSQTSIKTTIYLPADSYDNLKIKAATSDIKVPSDFTFANAYADVSTGNITFDANVTSDIDFESSTGDMHLNKVNAKSINLKASTGKMFLDNINAEQGIIIDVHTGDSRLNTVRAGALNIKSSTGKINLTDVVTTGKMTLETSTGDVYFDHCDASEISVKTSTGDVKGSILTSKVIFANSSTGDRKYPQRTEGGKFEINTSTGDINIQLLD